MFAFFFFSPALRFYLHKFDDSRAARESASTILIHRHLFAMPFRYTELYHGNVYERIFAAAVAAASGFWSFSVRQYRSQKMNVTQMR